MSEQPASLQPGVPRLLQPASPRSCLAGLVWHGDSGMVATRRSAVRLQRCLVTGGAGFLGRHLVERLLAVGVWQASPRANLGKPCCALLGACTWWSCQPISSASWGAASLSACPHPAAGSKPQRLSKPKFLCVAQRLLAAGLMTNGKHLLVLLVAPAGGLSPAQERPTVPV